MMKYRYIQSFLLIAFVVSAQFIFAQNVEAPHHYEQVNLDFGVHDGMSIDELDASGVKLTTMQPTLAKTIAFPISTYIIIEENINTVDHAPWLQLVFEAVNLGENSYLVITSDYDQDQQYFNSHTIEEWNYHSAYFKGESVALELYVAPGDEGVTLTVPDLIAGEYMSGQNIQLSLCATDDRLTSGYQHIEGRLMTFGCTGWISAAGYYLTAGHCEVLFTASTIMEFYVPASLCDGTTQPAAVNNQYPVISTTSTGQNAGVGDDWGIYNCGANSNTGLTPIEAQRAFYHLSRDLSPPNIFIRGFGTDETPLGCTNFRNAQSQTCQFQTGPSLGENVTSSNDIDWEYVTDTEGGNSGSAVVASGISGANFHSVGIHTHGGCSPPSFGNHGTSFEANDTEIAMNTFWQSEIEFVDVDHHLSSITGSSVQPHYSLQNALTQANAGHGPAVSALELIMITGSNYGSGGIYTQTLSYSGATNGVVLRQAVGAIKIGPDAVAAKSNVSNSETGEIK